jgi:hypothetical protein
MFILTVQNALINNYAIIYITITMEVYCAMISSTTILQIDFVWIADILMNVVTLLVECFISEIIALAVNKFMKFIPQKADYLLTTILFPIIYITGKSIISYLKIYCQVLDRFLSRLAAKSCRSIFPLRYSSTITVKVHACFLTSLVRVPDSLSCFEYTWAIS